MTSYDDVYYVPPQVKRETTKTTTSKSISTVREDDWKSLANSITYLFHKKQLQKLELDILNEKVRNVHSHSSKKGETIVECYKDSILKKGLSIFPFSFAFFYPIRVFYFLIYPRGVVLKFLFFTKDLKVMPSK